LLKKIKKIILLVAASAGLIADARTWVDRARTESQDYFFTYGQKIGVGHVTMKVIYRK
jgi:20S proteasome alpha/beta subunit